MYKKLIVITLFFSSPILMADGLLNYKPPKMEAMQTPQVGGGTRSLGQSQFYVLAPETIALTSTSQPILYWYKSTPDVEEVEILVSEENGEKFLLEKKVTVQNAGLQKISLLDNAVVLQPDKNYEWSVVSSKLETISAKLRYKSISSSNLPMQEKAAEGYWYDIFNQIVLSGDFVTANDLLKQIGVTISLKEK